MERKTGKLIRVYGVTKGGREHLRGVKVRYETKRGEYEVRDGDDGEKTAREAASRRGGAGRGGSDEGQGK